VEIAAGWGEIVRRHREEGWIVAGLGWQPEVASGQMTVEEVEAVFARTHALLGGGVEHAWCPHGEGPPVCWCRKPLPGLGVELVRRYRLDAGRSVYVGSGAQDPGFARRLGFPYRDAADFFDAPSGLDVEERL